MVDSANVVNLVETVLVEKETIHSFESYVGPSQQNNEKCSAQTLGCTACETYANKPEYVNQNKIKKRSQKSYPCSMCTASFRRRDHLKRHLSTVHSNPNNTEPDQYPQPLGCPVCDSQFTNKDVCDRHNEKNSRNDKRYQCSVCSASFRRNDHLKRHLSNVHSNSNNINADQYNQVFGCAACDVQFSNEDEFNNHNEKNCGAEKSYPCSVCAANFRRHDHLKRHLSSVHSNVKYYLCPVCNEDCKRHDMLLKHIKSRHSDETSIFRCKECGYECSSLNIYEAHEREHLLNERHLCPHCNTSFKRRDHMLRHIKSQHLLEFSMCPICEQTFKRKDHVARHIREKHRRQTPVC